MNSSRLRPLCGAAFAAFSLVSSAQTATADPGPDWTMFGGNAAHNGAVSATLGDGALQEVWRFGPFPNNLNHLTVAGGAVHATTTSIGTTGQAAVWTLDSRLGVLRWNRDLGRNNYLSPPSVGSGLLYLRRSPTLGSQNLLTALNPATGATAWETADDFTSAAACSVPRLSRPGSSSTTSTT